MNAQAPLAADVEVDLLVVGSGAAGLSAAVTAACRRQRVILVEKEPVLGGTTAWSGGWMWIPDSPPAVAAGMDESPADRARCYLEACLGSPVFGAQKEKIEAYLEHGPRMLAFFESIPRVGLQFDLDAETPDFHESRFARIGGRAVRVKAFDGRRLKQLIKLLRMPLDVLTVFGMGVETGADLRHFQNAARSRSSLWHVVRRLARYALDVLRYGRGMHLVNGNALVAALMHAAHELGVGLHASCAVRSLISEHGKVVGARVVTPAGEISVRANHGVVLACGGFPHDVARIRDFIPHASTGHEHWSAAPASNDGDGLRLGESVNGVVRATLSAPAAWAPVSLFRRTDGSTATYPHLLERGKPGIIAVDRQGRRFCDEAVGYHDFVEQWLKATPRNEPLEAWLICDRAFLWRYGLGAVKPSIPLPLWALRSGYLRSSRSVEGLARECAIDAAGLQKTLATYNADARRNLDSRFRRGESSYDQSQGDPAHRPNPCVAAIERPPFYAVRLQPGSLGTFAGLATNARAQVLDEAGNPIGGLYACGNDMAPVMGGFYPSSGITIGAAMTFGYLIGMGIPTRAGSITPAIATPDSDGALP